MEYATTYASFDPMSGTSYSAGEMRGTAPQPVPPADGWILVSTNLELSPSSREDLPASQFSAGRALLVWTWRKGQSVAT